MQQILCKKSNVIYPLVHFVDGKYNGILWTLRRFFLQFYKKNTIKKYSSYLFCQKERKKLKPNIKTTVKRKFAFNNINMNGENEHMQI